MESIFFELTIIICVAAFFSIVFRFFKQPSILAYILTGIILGPLGLFHIDNKEALAAFGQLGITLLLFTLGLELKITELRSIGKSAIIVGTLQMWFSFVAGFFLALLLGVGKIPSIYIGTALSFSSTIIIVKFLSDRKDLTSLHGKIAIGITLMQDLFAILVIVFLSSIHSLGGGDILQQTGVIIVKVTALFGVTTYLSTAVFPQFTRMIAKSSESLFLFSLGWVFLLSAIVSSPFIGFSVEIGGLLAGLALANAHENFQIIARMRSLRDFFVTIFFVMLGLQMTFANLFQILLPGIILSLFVIIIKPFIVMAIVTALGYRKRTSFLSGISQSQISEFSLIMIFLGNKLGFISNEIVTLLTFVGIITFAVSVYLLQNGNSLYKKFGKHLDIFNGSSSLEHSMSQDELSDLKDHVILVGAHQMGQSILRSLEGDGEKVLVVDFNPDITKKLKEEGVLSIFGDIADGEIQERIGLDRAKLIISTVPDLEDNLIMIEAMQRLNHRAKIVVMAFDKDEAKILYKAGADYVVMPHLAGGRHVAKMLKDKHLESLKEFKEKDLKYLE